MGAITIFDDFYNYIRFWCGIRILKYYSIDVLKFILEKIRKRKGQEDENGKETRNDRERIEEDARLPDVYRMIGK